MINIEDMGALKKNTPKFKVCILTSGRGRRMGPYADVINKALLPIARKAALTHIIEKFPKDTDFVISLGFFADQVQQYLALAHPEHNFSYVNVDNYEGPGSGPGHSLLECQAELQCPFFFVPCDTLWTEELLILEDDMLSHNWVGVAHTTKEEAQSYCNFEISEGAVIKIHDKVAPENSDFASFTGLCFIKDYDVFWKGLKKDDQENNQIQGEVQVSSGLQALVDHREVDVKTSHWQDIGELAKYQKVCARYENYDFSKVNEFFYHVDDTIIKFFSDESITDKRFQKGLSNTVVYPKMGLKAGGFYSYQRIAGETLYRTNSIAIFEQLLEWLQNHLWKKVDCKPERIYQACAKFYQKKTLQRIELYRSKYPQDFSPRTINGEKIPAFEEQMALIDWGPLFEGVPVAFHGDLQFDNILKPNDEARSFLLLDWRQDFGGEIDFGDLYYDFAKLNGGIFLNYDRIKQNHMSFEEDESGALRFDFEKTPDWQKYRATLFDFVDKNSWDTRKVSLLTALIYLNMSPLHHAPFDRLLFALGRSKLYEILKSN